MRDGRSNTAPGIRACKMFAFAPHGTRIAIGLTFGTENLLMHTTGISLKQFLVDPLGVSSRVQISKASSRDSTLKL